MQRFHVFEKYFFCELVAFFNYGMNLVINLCGNFFGIVTCLREFFSEENLLMTGAEYYRTERIAHTILSDHFTRNFGCTLNIIGSSCGNIVKHKLFRDTTTEQSRYAVDHLIFIHAVLILLRE